MPFLPCFWQNSCLAMTPLRLLWRHPNLLTSNDGLRNGDFRLILLEPKKFAGLYDRQAYAHPVGIGRWLVRDPIPIIVR